MNPIWLLFGFRGRIGRIAFVVGLILALVILFAGIWASGEALAPMARVLAPRGINAAFVQNGMWIALALLFTWMLLALTMKRLHDRGRSGLLAVLSILPAAAVLFATDTVFVGPHALTPPEPAASIILALAALLSVWLAAECVLLRGRTRQRD